SRAEESFTWAIGQESHLILPFGRDAREFVLTMNVIPFVHPPALPAQRLIVSVDETTIGTASISRPAVLAWRIPAELLRRSERTLVTLSHPDAARPRDVSGATDGRELAVSVSEVRLYYLPAAMAADHPLPVGLALGGAVNPGFGIHPGIELKEWVMRRTGLSFPELATKFESIGDNCEFGLVQRRCDAEPLGLLRFSGSFSNQIVRGIELEFEGIGEPADITPRLEGDEGRREFMIHERKYGLVYHTFVYEGERAVELMRQQEATRLQFLRRKFVEELRAGEKIFVFKSAAAVTEAEILPLFMALNRNQSNTLLWVVPEEQGRPGGTVEVLMNGLLKGYIDRFAPVDNAHRFSFEAWVVVCVHAFLLNRMMRAAA
ncbi:MAG: hypothetical protein ABSA58_26015, partial [Acetobacteraceae bacterium]